MSDIVLTAVAVVLTILVLRILVPRLVHRRVVHDYEAGLLYRSGKFIRRLDPGAYFFTPFWTEITLVDLRKRVATIPGQEVLSADNVGLKVSIAVTYQVTDPARATHQIQSYEEALHVFVQLALRAAVASAKVDELLQQRLAIGQRLAETLRPQLEALGLQLELVEVKDVMFPGELKKIFAEVVRAQKEGQAALERARGETAALRSLANAARMLEENPALMNLRVLQSISGSGTSGNTVVLGVPQGMVPLSRKPPGSSSETG